MLSAFDTRDPTEQDGEAPTYMRVLTNAALSNFGKTRVKQHRRVSLLQDPPGGE